MFMREKLEKRKNEVTNFYGFEDLRGRTSQSAFVNDNVFGGMFFIDKDITEESANTFIQDLKWFIDYQMKRAPQDRLPVKIYINTPGGYCYEGLAMINAIRSCPLQTIGIATGKVMSMGIPILASCRIRLAYEHAAFMIHSVAGGAYGKIQDMREDMEVTEALFERMNNFLVREVEGITDEILADNAKRKHDWFFFSEEALEIGLVEDVIGDWEEYEKKMHEQESKMFEAINKFMGPKEDEDEDCDCDGECTCKAEADKPIVKSGEIQLVDGVAVVKEDEVAPTEGKEELETPKENVMEFNDNVTIDGDLFVEGDLIVDGKLKLTGEILEVKESEEMKAVKISSGIHMKKDLTVKGDLVVSGKIFTKVVGKAKEETPKEAVPVEEKPKKTKKPYWKKGKKKKSELDKK